MNAVVVTTFIYLVIAFALVIAVIPQWQRSGKEYLTHVFSTEERAEAVNRLLVTGLSLITMSLALFLMGIGSADTSEEAVMSLFIRLAGLLALVGAAFFVNLGAYWYLGRRIAEERADTDGPAVDEPVGHGPTAVAPIVPNTEA